MENKDVISFELKKVVKYTDLKPFGKFTIKFKTRQRHLHNIIPFDELECFHDEGMPISEEQDKLIVKFMRKNKTDILWDEIYHNFYTRAGNSFVRVYHKKLKLYIEDEGFRSLFPE